MTEIEAANCTMKRYIALRKKAEEQRIELWRLARWKAWMDLNGNPNLKTRPNRPEDLFELPGDKKRWVEKVEITEDVVTALKKIGLIGDC